MSRRGTGARSLPLAQLFAEACLPIDKAIDQACVDLGLPLLGGPSGKGWSYWQRAFKCLRLFCARTEDGLDDPSVAEQLQVGALFHVLQAFYYAPGIDNCVYADRGLAVHRYAAKLMSIDRVVGISPYAADDLLSRLKAMAAEGERAITDPVAGGGGDEVPPQAGPSLKVILEAERLFEAHTLHWESRERITPLAIEWLAVNPRRDHTCRYDMIVRAEPGDPMLSPGTWIVERKTSRFLVDSVNEGWYLDGEILGQLMDWRPSGCEAVFGPLQGLCVDIVTKDKTPACVRVMIPAENAAVGEFERALQWIQAEVTRAKVSGFWPKTLNACYEARGTMYERRCVNFDVCRRGD